MNLSKDSYQYKWNGLYMRIKERIREIDEAERVTGYMDDYLEIERDTLQGIIWMMEREY